MHRHAPHASTTSPEHRVTINAGTSTHTSLTRQNATNRGFLEYNTVTGAPEPQPPDIREAEQILLDRPP
jgi:hypothetical protein